MTFDASPALQLWAGGGIYTGGDRPLGIEDREDFDEGRGGLRWLSPSGGIATLSVFGNKRLGSAKSMSINSDRTAETPQRFNNSPARSRGVSLQWTQMAFQRHELTVGADYSSANGKFLEHYAYTNGAFTRSRLPMRCGSMSFIVRSMTASGIRVSMASCIATSINCPCPVRWR